MKTITKTLLVLTSLVSLNSFGQAVLSTSCPVSSKIRLPKNSSGFYMSADCKTVYLLPPVNGHITLEGVLSSSSMEGCSTMRQIRKNLKEIQKKLTEELTSSESVPDDQTRRGSYGRISTSGRDEREQRVPLTDEQIELLIKKKQIAEEILKSYSQRHGATVALLYSTGYGDQLNEVRTLNQRLGLNFTHLPLKNTKFKFLSVDEAATDEPLVLRSSFPVEDAMGMNGSLSGYVDLSMLGACPLTRPGLNSVSQNLNTRKLSSALTANLGYEYDLQTSVDYKASLNFGGLAQKIKESSKRGGFFKTETLSKFVSTSKSESWFEYSYKCDDTRACEAAHDQNILEIKKRMMDEVLTNILLTKTEAMPLPEGAADPGQSGSRTAAEQLKKCTHLYCQIGAGVLAVASDTFGSESKTDKYIKSESHWVSETAQTRKAFSFSGTMGFTPKE